MSARLVQTRRKWEVGLKMADFEMINLKTGDRLTIAKDGSELRDEVTPPEIDWCDKGQHYALRANGRYVGDMLWYCEACK